VSGLADEIRAIALTIDAEDPRSESIRDLAGRVDLMHSALCNVINRWTRHSWGDFDDADADLTHCQCSRCLAIDSLPDIGEAVPHFFTEAEARALADKAYEDAVAMMAGKLAAALKGGAT
jgi:hypothetical protein